MGSKFVYAILLVFTNGFGVPSFLQGRKKTGLVRLITAFCTFGICYFINTIMGILLAIQVMGLSNEEFDAVKYEIDKGFPSAKMLGEGAPQKSSGVSYDDADYDDAPVASSSASEDLGYNVLLDDCGYDKNAVLQAIVDIRECSVEEALEIVDEGIVLQEVSEEEADAAVEILRAAGATVVKEEAYDYEEFSPEAMLSGDDEE